MPPPPRYSEPFFWWGPSWAGGKQRRIGELLRDGTLDVEIGALLWAALARRQSLAVIAGPSGAGKSTVLGGLLDLLPPEMRRVYLRGSFETFAFLTDPEIVARQTSLVVNEISPHLPVYLWGPAVARLLETAERGFTIMATAHAASVTEFVGMLAGSPLRIEPRRIAAFRYVVLVERDAGRESGRRVSGVWHLSGTRNGVAVAASWLAHNISHEDNQPAPLFPHDELSTRSRLLIALCTGQITDERELLSRAADLLGPIAP